MLNFMIGSCSANGRGGNGDGRQGFPHAKSGNNATRANPHARTLRKANAGTATPRALHPFSLRRGIAGAADNCCRAADGAGQCAGREARTMTITITAFDRSPDGGMGLARDTRVRWALEEAGLPYEVRLVTFAAMKEPAHLALHPFGQIPTYEEGDLALFETGAIVLHIAQAHAGLLPNDVNARARAVMWMFAAINTIEPPILELANAKFLEAGKPWTQERMKLIADRARVRLKQLSARLGDAEWLDGAFGAGDLMMVSVLLRLRPSGLLDEFPNLATYVARGESRPAYKRAFAAQLAANTRP
jgi:glutathione S-transferase